MSKTQFDGKAVKGHAIDIPEELAPVYDWLVENGKDVLLGIGIAFLCVIAVSSFNKYRASSAERASAAILSANDVAGLEEANAKFGGSKSGPVIRLRLARAYFDAGNYETAADTYAAFVKSNKKHPLADEARLGYAAALEAQKKFDEAKAAYAAIAPAEPTPASILANIGIARCLAATGAKADAKAALETLAANLPPSMRWKATIDSAIELVENFDGFRAESSLFDQMTSLQETPAPADAADVAADAPAPAAEDEAAAPAPAEEAKAAPAPEAKPEAKAEEKAAAPAPEAKPEAKAEEKAAAPAPEAKPEAKAEEKAAAPEAEAKPEAKAEEKAAAPAPEAKAEEKAAAPAPEAKPEAKAEEKAADKAEAK